MSIYQQNLKEKTNQMKAMAAELNMYQAQVNEYKYEKERMIRELQELKRKYYEQRRKERLMKESTNMNPGMGGGKMAMPQQSDNPNHPKFTGGGFAMST